jgi:hypothetical protein
MNFVKYLMPIIVAAGFTAATLSAQQQETEAERQRRETDDTPLREFVESKENIDIKKKANNLDISGDVRFEWRSIHEKGIALFCDECSDDYSYTSGCDTIREIYRPLRGSSCVDRFDIPVSTNDFDIDFNFKLKYSFGRSWMYAHLQYDNSAGIKGRNPCVDVYPIFDCSGSNVKERVPRDLRRSEKGSGTGDRINLKRAFMGYNIWADGKQRLDIEFGRRKLDDIFFSEIQFSNRFDGILLKYAGAIDEDTDWYWENGGFVIDEQTNHYGYATEIGVLNLFDTGLDLRYSFIDWIKHGENRCKKRNPLGAQFAISQFSFVYTINPEFDCKVIPFEFYGGFLINHAAEEKVFTANKKKNLGGFGGLTIGTVRKEGDWSIDIEYLYVQAQAVSESDVGGMCRGNILDENLTDIVDVSVKDAHGRYCSKEVYFPRRGNTNFKGWRFEYLYAITDNLSVDVIYEYSREEDRKIGGPHRYSDFEIEMIYAF